MSLFGLGKKKEEVKIEPACACNGEVATYEASSCCCGGQQVENCCGGDNMAYGVMSMPAIVVNETVASMGKVLKSAEVIKLFGKLGF